MVVRRREGAGKARALGLLTGAHLGVAAPWDRVQIDSTPCDIRLVREAERTVIGRPTITFAIDIYRRVTLGFSVSLQSASTVTVATCLAQAHYRAATVMLLKRSLRNGSASVDHSLNHKAPEDRLIPVETWTRERGRMIHELNVPASAQSYLSKLEAALVAGLAALDEAVGAGVLEIEDGRVVLPRLKAQTEDAKVMDGRRVLFGHLGSVQLPSVLVEVDSRTRFSWSLLGRAPRSEQELVTVYAALLALGSDLTAADLMRMTPGIGADSIGQMMVRLEAGDLLRQANTAVLAHMRG